VVCCLGGEGEAVRVVCWAEGGPGAPGVLRATGREVKAADEEQNAGQSGTGEGCVECSTGAGASFRKED
jgi:hypothetical protein